MYLRMAVERGCGIQPARKPQLEPGKEKDDHQNRQETPQDLTAEPTGHRHRRPTPPSPPKPPPKDPETQEGPNPTPPTHEPTEDRPRGTPGRGDRGRRRQTGSRGGRVEPGRGKEEDGSREGSRRPIVGSSRSGESLSQKGGVGDRKARSKRGPPPQDQDHRDQSPPQSSTKWSSLQQGATEVALDRGGAGSHQEQNGGGGPGPTPVPASQPRERAAG